MTPLVRALALLLALPLAPAPAPRCMATTTTAYSRQSFPGITASGKPTASVRAAAVHTWSDLAFGTQVWVGDLGIFEVADTGDPEGIVPDPWLDLITDTDAQAIEYGTRVRLVCVGGSPF